MYWIFLPSFFIWLLYIAVKGFSSDLFEEIHLYEKWNLFGWEIDLSSIIDNTEWFYYIVLFELFKFFILTILSPFNAFVSEIYDQKLTGNNFKFSFTRLIKDIGRGLIITLTGFSLEMFLGGFWLLFSLFLPLEFLTPIFFLILSSFFYGFAYIDYSLERHGKDVIKSWNYAFKNFKFCFFTGLIFSLIMYIPHAGLILAPPLITILSTHHYLKTPKGSNQKNPERVQQP